MLCRLFHRRKICMASGKWKIRFFYAESAWSGNRKRYCIYLRQWWTSAANRIYRFWPGVRRGEGFGYWHRRQGKRSIPDVQSTDRKFCGRDIKDLWAGRLLRDRRKRKWQTADAGPCQENETRLYRDQPGSHRKQQCGRWSGLWICVCRKRQKTDRNHSENGWDDRGRYNTADPLCKTGQGRRRRGCRSIDSGPKTDRRTLLCLCERSSRQHVHHDQWGGTESRWSTWRCGKQQTAANLGARQQTDHLQAGYQYVPGCDFKR